jgi:PAS domain S-box-containing protein
MDSKILKQGNNNFLAKTNSRNSVKRLELNHRRLAKEIMVYQEQLKEIFEKNIVHENIWRQKEYQAKQDFNRLIQNSYDIIAIIDSKGKFYYITPSFERLTGYTVPKTCQKSIFDFIYPDDKAVISSMISKLIEKPRLTFQIEYRFRCRNNTWRFFKSRCRNLIDDSVISDIVMNSCDISKEKFKSNFS